MQMWTLSSNCTYNTSPKIAVKIKVGQTLEFKGDHEDVILTQLMGSCPRSIILTAKQKGCLKHNKHLLRVVKGTSAAGARWP